MDIFLIKLYRGKLTQLVCVDSNYDDTSFRADDSSGNYSQQVNSVYAHDVDHKQNNDVQKGPENALSVPHCSTKRGGDIDQLNDDGDNTTSPESLSLLLSKAF